MLAELCRRDLVPALWLPSLDERALRERLKRRMHLVRMRTMARNRIHGVLTQWGLKLPTTRLRQPDAMDLLERRGVPEVWRRSVAEALAAIDWLDGRITPLERELFPLARADARVQLLETIPGIGPLLGLTLATEIGDVARFSSARKLDRLRRPGADAQAVGAQRAHGAALQGRLEDLALGRRRGRPAGLACRPTPGTSSTARPPSARARPTPARRPSPARS